MERKKISILGASGYTGAELLRFLLVHPAVEVTHLTAEKHAGKSLGEVFPHLSGYLDLELVPLAADTVPSDIDIVFAALPHGASAEVISELYNRNIKIIDLGADFRLSQERYEAWYAKHPCPELLEEAVYGLPELNRHKIKNAKLVANTGCYPVSAILPLAPLLIENVIEKDSIIVDSKSGVTGAGRSPSLDLHYSEVNEGFKAYKIGQHRHMPEIEEVLSNYSGQDVSVMFSPHLVPMDRGILSTIYVKLTQKSTTEDLLALYDKHYENEKFVRIAKEGSIPSTAHVKGSNFCDIGLRVNEHNNTAVIVSVIDNLVKGASGQAVQNMNIMMGWDEAEGIYGPPMFP